MDFQDWMLDKRVIKRNINNGLITRQEYHNYIKSLPDRLDNVTTMDDDIERSSFDRDDDESSSTTNDGR